MYKAIEVTDGTYYLGVNDRRTHLFENMWPLPYGVSYNAYLIQDEKTALIDTVEYSKTDEFLSHIEQVIGREGMIDYLIINHMEPDHSGAIQEVVQRYPSVKIVGNLKTFKIIDGYYGYKDNLVQVEDGDTLELGKHILKFVMTPWVHWPETMMTLDMKTNALFSGDAFGTFGSLDGGIFDDEIEFDFYEDEMRRYYSNIVGKYSNMVQKAFNKLEGTQVDYICPTHGPVWRDDVSKVLDLYKKWSSYETEPGVVIVYGSMYGNTAKMADTIARKIAEMGVKKIRVHDISKTHLSYIINDIWKFRAVILGSCAYNSGMLPTMENLTRTLEHMSIKEHYLGVFGSYSWNGGGVKSLMKFKEAAGWEMVGDPVEVKGIPRESAMERCITLAEAVANKLRS